jgi:hypothetical protein
MPATHDRGSGPYLDGRPLTPERLHQQILNQSWPQRDKDGFHARDVQPARRADGSPWTIDVEVRIEFDGDGETVLAGRAERWNATHVFVAAINDPRVPRPGVWVEARDVRRAES